MQTHDIKPCRSEAVPTSGWMLSVIFRLLFLRAPEEKSLKLTNKNVTQTEETTRRNDSINNDRDFSRIHLQLAFLKSTSRTEHSESSLLQSEFPSSYQSQRQIHPRQLTRLIYRLLLCFLHLWCRRGSSPCYSASSYTEIAEQRAVRRVNALSQRPWLKAM